MTRNLYVCNIKLTANKQKYNTQDCLFSRVITTPLTMRGGRNSLPFPKGWNRVVAAQRHLTEGAAGKTTLHRLDARREASIKRSRCGNSEAIVGVAVTATDTIVQASRRDTTKGWWTMSLIVQFAKISTLSATALSSGLPRRRLLTLKGDTQHCLYICIAVVGRGVTTQRHLFITPTISN